MRRVTRILVVIVPVWFIAASLLAQVLGPHVRKIKEGIYIYAARETDSNCGIILTQEGVVLIDSGRRPTDSHKILSVVKKLTSLPIRFLINTEPHVDHTIGHFVFSPPASIIAHEGATESMRQAYNPERNQERMAESPEMREAFEGYRLITPHIEYREKMTLHLGEKVIELLYLKNVHSEADTAIWLPQERVVFSAATVGVKRFPNIRPFVTIPDILAAIKMMKSLNPEIVVPGHGSPGTTQIFDEMERYYALLLERVGKMVGEGKSLQQIKQELRMPEYDDWVARERIPTNIEAAYRAVSSH